MISFAEFYEQIIGKKIAVTTDRIQVVMTASHVLIGNEIIDEDTETSVVIRDSDKIYEYKEDIDLVYEIRDNSDKIIFYVTLL